MKTQNLIYIVIITLLLGVIIFDLIRIENIKTQLGIKGDNINYLKKPSISEQIGMLKNSSNSQALSFQKYLFYLSNDTTKGTHPISVDSASEFYTWRLKFKDRLANSITGLIADTFKMDETEAIFFEFPKFINALTNTYGNNICSPGFWDDKGFIIYLGNYREWGNKQGEHTYNTNLILQFARLGSVVQGEWTPENNMKPFDFGDLKPPKKIRGETITRNP